MRRLPRVLLWVAGTFAVAAIALLIVLLTVDADAYRPMVEQQLTHNLGRPVAIERLSFDWSLQPSLAVRGLRIANPPWAATPNLVTAQRGALRIDLVALLEGHVQIRSLSLEGVDLRLERNRDGEGNWVLGRTGDGRSEPSQPRLPDFDSISVRALQIGWRSAGGEMVRGEIDEASAMMRADRPFTLSARGRVRDTPLALEATANTSLQSALSGQPLTTSIVLGANGVEARAEIAMPNLFAVRGMRVKLDARGKRLDALSALAGRALPAWGPFQIAADAAVGDERVQLTAMRLTIDGLPFPPRSLEVSSGEATLGARTPTLIRLTGQAAGAPLRVDAETAALPTLFAPAAALPLKGTVTLAGLTVAIAGSVDRNSGPPAFAVSLDASGEAQEAARILGLASFRRGVPLRLSVRLAASRERVQLNDLRGVVAGCTIAGNLLVERAALPRVSGKLVLGRLDPAAFALRAEEATTGAPAQASPGAPAWLTALDADLQLAIASVAGLAVPAANLSAHAILADGRLRVHGFSGSLANTRLSADAQLEWRATRPYVDATVRVPVVDFAALTAGSGGEAGADALDRALPLAPLRAVDADLQLDIGRVENAPLRLDGLRATARLARGNLTVSPLQLVLAGAAVRSTLTLNARGDEAQLTGNIATAQIDLANLRGALTVPAAWSGTLGPMALTGQTQGATPRAWVEQARLSVQLGRSTLVPGDETDAIRIAQGSATAAPGMPARAQLRGSVRDLPFELSATGGPLAALLGAGSTWPQVTVAGEVTVHGQQVRVSARGGPLQQLIEGRNVVVQIDAATDGARLALSGTITDLRKPGRTPLRVEAAATTLARLPVELGGAPLPDVPLDASATVVLDARSVSVDGLLLRAGGSDLTGTVRIERNGRLKVSAELNASVLDLRPWLQNRARQTTQTDAASRPSAAAFLDRPIPVAALRGVDAALRLQVAHVLTPALDLERYRLQGRLDDGLLHVSQAVAEGDLHVEAQLNVRGEVPAAAVRVTARDLDLETLKLEAVNAMGSGLPRITLDAQIAGLGDTLRQMNTSAQGRILVTAGAGQIRAVASPLVFQDVFVSLLDILAPGRKPDDYANLECGAARFAVANGIASSPDGIALRFKRMDILGSGAVNLSSGEILFGFKAVRRSWLSLSAIGLASDFAKVSGTLAHPKVGLDAEEVLIKGAAAWATLGISLLASDFLRKLQANKDPCKQIVAKGRTAEDPLDALIRALPLPGRKPPGPSSGPTPPSQ